MTCIVGLVDAGKVYIGGDSAGVAGWDLTVRADSKVFRNGAFLFGFTSSFRMGQLLRYSFVPPDRNDDVDVERFMCTTFVGAVRACLKDGGFAEKTNEKEKGGEFLVGYAGRLFSVHEDYQVAESVAGYAACGCGESYARGALYATDKEPHSRVLLALMAAERHSAGVRGPFHIETLEPIDEQAMRDAMVSIPEPFDALRPTIMDRLKDRHGPVQIRVRIGDRGAAESIGGSETPDAGSTPAGRAP